MQKSLMTSSATNRRQQDSHKTKTFSLILDAVKDEEIENWAAAKIQSSFKQYRQKTLSIESSTASGSFSPSKVDKVTRFLLPDLGELA